MGWELRIAKIISDNFSLRKQSACRKVTSGYEYNFYNLVKFRNFIRRNLRLFRSNFSGKTPISSACCSRTSCLPQAAGISRVHFAALAILSRRFGERRSALWRHMTVTCSPRGRGGASCCGSRRGMRRPASGWSSSTIGFFPEGVHLLLYT